MEELLTLTQIKNQLKEVLSKYGELNTIFSIDQREEEEILTLLELLTTKDKNTREALWKQIAIIQKKTADELKKIYEEIETISQQLEQTKQSYLLIEELKANISNDDLLKNIENQF